jgi:hypothetical protein
VHVFAAPLSRLVFEKYHMVMARTFSELNIYDIIGTGPRISAMILRRIATEMGIWEGENGVERGLVAEMRRLANVIVNSERGWEPIPLEMAVKREILDEDEASEVENAITFFIVAWAMYGKARREPVLQGAAVLWGAQITSSTLMDYIASLPISMTGADIGQMSIHAGQASSIPS